MGDEMCTIGIQTDAIVIPDSCVAIADTDKFKDNGMQMDFSFGALCELVPISDPSDLINVVSYNAVMSLMNQITACSAFAETILTETPAVDLSALGDFSSVSCPSHEDFDNFLHS